MMELKTDSPSDCKSVVAGDFFGQRIMHLCTLVVGTKEKIRNEIYKEPDETTAILLRHEGGGELGARSQKLFYFSESDE